MAHNKDRNVTLTSDVRFECHSLNGGRV